MVQMGSLTLKEKFFDAARKDDMKSVYAMFNKDINICMSKESATKRNILHLIATREVKIKILDVMEEFYFKIGNNPPYFLEIFNASDDKGNTPLMLAVLYNNIMAVNAFYASYDKILTHLNYSKMQIRQGICVTINYPNCEGQTPLHIAAKHHNIHMIHTLIDAKADVNIKDHNGNTPAHLAAKAINANIENIKNVIKILAGAGSNPEDRNNEGNTILDEVYIRNMSLWSKTVDNFEIKNAYINYPSSVSFTQKENFRRNNKSSICSIM